ncbi:c2h2 transcription protein [Rutstroemia sp. NJR-2017a WRK4]|nr:c2h2 transcription protein [Rutstroemia sp. NJR-2017a WRK4]
MTNTIAVTSFLKSSSTSAISTSLGNAAAVGTSTGSSASATSTTASTSGLSHQNLIIILACVLGALALIISGALIYIFIRYRRSRSLAARGVTPIDDEEIESWRRSAQDRKSSFAQEHSRSFEKEIGSRSYMDSNTIQMSHSPGWTWTASPTSSRSHSAFYPSGVSSNIPDTPRFFAQAFAQAPNARIGLTDETVPGAEPFIKPAKRQSSRLSKSSPNHARSKSRRSSMSARSVWSVKSGHAELKANDRVATWYDPEDDFRVVKDYTESPAFTSREGTPAPVTALAPRPPARPMFWDGDSRRSSWDKDPDIGEIGLAIS